MLPLSVFRAFLSSTAILLALMTVFSSTAVLSADNSTPYAGFENREIKSLSNEDISALRAGAGWGLALPAELNGLPGPAHLLELKSQVGLNEDQIRQIELSFAQMQSEARSAGERFIAAEASLDTALQQGELNLDRLRMLIDAAASARAELRFIHLSRHLEMKPLLTSDQINLYNELRGYGSADPCSAVPEGHDPAMWRRHNQC